MHSCKAPPISFTRDSLRNKRWIQRVDRNEKILLFNNFVLSPSPSLSLINGILILR